MIAAVTAGWRITNASAEVDQRDIGLVGQPGKRVAGLQLGLVGGKREVAS
jgi:hypothetical protein